MTAFSKTGVKYTGLTIAFRDTVKLGMLRRPPIHRRTSASVALTSRSSRAAYSATRFLRLSTLAGVTSTIHASRIASASALVIGIDCLKSPLHCNAFTYACVFARCMDSAFCVPIYSVSLCTLLVPECLLDRLLVLIDDGYAYQSVCKRWLTDPPL